LLNLLGGIDFKSIACDKDLLKQYMVFRKDVDVALVTKELCAINSNNISSITEMVQNQLDIGEIIRMVRLEICF